MKVQVFDAIMGYGKSTYAIETIDSEPDNFYFVVLPFLSEVERYKTQCQNVELQEPSSENTSKGADLLNILKKRQNVVTTHNLFEQMNDDHFNVLRKLPLVRGEKVLILDETIDLVRTLSDTKLTKGNLKADHDAGWIIINEETGKVQWNTAKEADGFDGYDHHEHLKALCETGQLFFIDDRYVILEVSTEFLACFDRVLVMTYRWDSSIMAIKLSQLQGVEIEKVQLNEDRLMEVYKYIADHLEIPDTYCAGENLGLSKNGMEGNVDEVASLVNHTVKEAMNDYGVTLDMTRYTTFKDAHGFSFIDYFKSRKIGKYQKKDSQGKVVPVSFLSHTALGTNEHSHCKLMVYGIDKHLHPGVGAFFSKHGASISYDEWALSSMIQWLFRGCIRDHTADEKMIAVILSPRMREMAQGWLAGIKHQAKYGLNRYEGAFARLSTSDRRNKKHAYKKFIKDFPSMSHVTLDEFVTKGRAGLKREMKKAA